MTEIVNWARQTFQLGDIAFIVAILTIGTALLFGRPRWGRRWFVAVALLYWVVSTPLGSDLLVRPLSTGYQPIKNAAAAGDVGAIVVLGAGSYEFTAGSDVLPYPTGGTALRALEGARVFRLLSGRLPVVASGGTPGVTRRLAEANVIADALVSLDVPRDRIILEDQSINTHDQSIMVTRLLASRNIHRFVLITSPSHMPRSVRVFRAQGADVVPSAAPPVSGNVRPRRFFAPNGQSFGLSNEAVYEYAGFVYYWARGWFREAAADSDR